MQRKKNDFRMARRLFLYFFKIGWFTFGGGFSIIAQMQKDFVEKRHEVSEETLLDQTSLGRSLPGLMIANVSYLFGYSLGGVAAGLGAVLGIILPPIIMLAVVTFFYTAFRDNEYVARALVGVRAAVVPIIAMAALKLRKGAFKDGVPSYVLMLGALALGLFTKISIIYIILGAAAAGIIIMEVKRRGAA